MSRVVRAFREWLLWLSAADREVIRRSGEETRFVAAGGAVLGTATMAAIAATFTGYTMFRLGPVAAGVFGLGWALLIMNLERYVQSSIRRQRTPGMTLLSAVPRVGLAVLLGILLAPPILLWVFRTEVGHQLTEDHNAKVTRAEKTVQREVPQIPGLEARVSELERDVQKPLTVGAALGSSPEYHRLAQRYGQFRSEANHAQDPRSAARLNHAAEVTLAMMLPLRERLLAEEKEGETSRAHEQRRQLDLERTELAEAITLRKKKLGTITGTYKHFGGLAEHLAALDSLVRRDPVVGGIKKALWLFIIVVDCLPAIMRVLQYLGRPTVYEQVDNAIAARKVREARARERLLAKLARLGAEEELDVERKASAERTRRAIELQTRLDNVSFEIFEEVVTPAVEEWAKETSQEYARDLGEDARRAGPGAPPAGPESPADVADAPPPGTVPSAWQRRLASLAAILGRALRPERPRPS